MLLRVYRAGPEQYYVQKRVWFLWLFRRWKTVPAVGHSFRNETDAVKYFEGFLAAEIERRNLRKEFYPKVIKEVVV